MGHKIKKQHRIYHTTKTTITASPKSLPLFFNLRQNSSAPVQQNPEPNSKHKTISSARKNDQAETSELSPPARHGRP